MKTASAAEASLTGTGDGKTAISDFLKRFKECEELNWPLSEEVTNEYIEALLYIYGSR